MATLEYGTLYDDTGAVVDPTDARYSSMIGHFGGEATKSLYGMNHFKEAGSKGGSKLRDTRGPDYFRELAKRPRKGYSPRKPKAKQEV